MVTQEWSDEMTEIETIIIHQWFKTPQGKHVTERQVMENKEPSLKQMLYDICREINTMDARLVATAPELLDVCKSIVKLSKDQGRVNLPILAGFARIAITKATGQEPEA